MCLSCGDNIPAPEYTAPEDNPDPAKKEIYRIFLGNTHAHCKYSGDANQTDENSVEKHFLSAKSNGYDFYCITDHSQYETFTPQAWDHMQSAADAVTDASFVAIRGYEHSENNGPGAKGHMNVYNSTTYLNALAAGIDLAYFHNWLAETANTNVIVSMNHPKTDQYGNFACHNEQARRHIALIELINGTNCHYDSFLAALSKGWKVSPVAGCDNHTTEPIAKWQPRTGVAAKRLTRTAILDAMAAGRTYATYDKNLKLLYYVNNHVMGSEIRTTANTLTFEIDISDPDISDASNRITRIEIVDEENRVVASETFSEHRVHWEKSVPRKDRYYYLKVYNLSSDAPVAYTAPVWLK